MGRSQEVGREHQDEFQPGFHDRLARNWPEPREQLHAGGWEATQSLVQEIGIQPRDSVLDVGCGEGGSAVAIAGTVAARVVGIDILLPAVQVAKARAYSQSKRSIVSFVCSNLFSLPFPDATFDAIMGQDPDGFAHAERAAAFKECFRVLRSGGRLGIHHWIPGPGAPPYLTALFDQANVEAGFPSHADVHADAYAQAMEEASFSEVRVVDKSSMYRRHMLAIRDRAHDRKEEVDLWTATWLDLAERHPFGVMMLGRKT